MGAREEILAALGKNSPPGAPHPGLEGVGLRLDDPLATFEASVSAVGGSLLRAPDLAAADAALKGLAVYREARQVVSLVPGVGTSSLDLAAVSDPHALQGLDLVVLPAELGVAENGACWVEGAALPFHALAVIPQHLAVVVQASAVVPDLHAAYRRLGLAERPRWGLFLAGPSKTADIEQSLVIGAHGARSSVVLLVGAR